MEILPQALSRSTCALEDTAVLHVTFLTLFASSRAPGAAAKRISGA